MPRTELSERSVVVTGLGVITPLGDSVADYWAALVAGRSGITRWRQQDPRIASKIGGDLSDFDVARHLDRVGAAYPSSMIPRLRRLLRATPLVGQLVATAAVQAYVDAGLDTGGPPPERRAHVLAGHNLNLRYAFETSLTLQDEPDFIDALYGLYILDTDPLALTSELLAFKGPTFTIGNACASGNLALLAGLDLLRAGRADLVLVTGASMDPDPATLHSWGMMEAISCRSFDDAPERASRPFDARREGFVPSHGSAAVVLETRASARARGARVHGALLGAASTADASRLPKADLDGQVRAMRDALADAGVAPHEVDYVNAHATSTPQGDAVEVAAIKQVLTTRAYEIPVNSTKSMLGHCLSAAGVAELVATLLQMQQSIVHPTINQDEPDPELDLDFVPNVARPHPIGVAISNSFGFGGLNSCVVVGRAD